MKKEDVKCPECGEMNHSLYLEETNGFMECRACGCTAQLIRRNINSGDKNPGWQVIKTWPAIRRAV